MPFDLPPQPEFGQPLPVGAAAPEVLGFLALRRSASAAFLTAPGPDASELEEILRVAARAPDHGKLFPWRFVVLEGEAKAAYAARLEPLAARQPNPDKARGALAKVRNPPLSVAVISHHHPEATIPEWEQRLSAAAVCTLMIIAVQAMGYGANWITDWYSYDAEALAVLGLQPGEQVAGFVHMGTPVDAPLERARPDVASLTSRWEPRA